MVSRRFSAPGRMWKCDRQQYCSYLCTQSEDFKDLYPIKDSQKAADYEQYLNLMQTMYRYMKPGFMGYPLIGRFAKDFKRYAKDHGITLSSEQLFYPKVENRHWILSCQH